VRSKPWLRRRESFRLVDMNSDVKVKVTTSTISAKYNALR
jgi:hypothetical protein